MSGFFEELKRRKVYRVAIAYVVASWALAQGLAQVLPVFEISNSVIRVVIALLLIGFPLALVLAWARLRTGGLLAPVTMHIVTNALSLLAHR